MVHTELSSVFTGGFIPYIAHTFKLVLHEPNHDTLLKGMPSANEGYIPKENQK